MSGGKVCRTVRGGLCDGRRVVVKYCPYPALVEADGLRALAGAGVPVPEVIAAAGTVLVLQHVEGPPDWAGLGRAVAGMHRTTAVRYGWHQDNRCGRFVQPNGWLADWPTFYAERRVRVHCADPAIGPEVRRRLERACDGPLPALLPTRPVASLTHGDLWVGNIISGRCIVDPEVSFADRELDLAYMLMGSGLPAEFLAAYLAEWPVDPGFEARRPALQLHHLLLQVRHFGASRLSGVVDVLDHYGW